MVGYGAMAAQVGCLRKGLQDPGGAGTRSEVQSVFFWVAFGISTHGKMRGTCASKWSELPLLTFMEHVTIICIYHCIQESQMVFLWVKVLFTNPISLTSADQKRMVTACTECCIIKVEVALVIIRTTVSTWDKNELKQIFFLKIVGFGSPKSGILRFEN